MDWLRLRRSIEATASHAPRHRRVIMDGERPEGVEVRAAVLLVVALVLAGCGSAAVSSAATSPAVDSTC